MTTGVTYALLSLSFAGINDIIYKKYSGKDRSRGMYIFGIGVVWGVLQLAALAVVGRSVSFDWVSVASGISAGAILTTSNMLLLESYTHIDISLGATIYRLNTIIVVILSFLLLNESLGTMKLLGILLGITAVFFLYQKQHQRQTTQKFTLFFYLAILASVMRALYGVTTKAALIHHADPKVMLLIISVCWVFGGMIYAIVKEKRFRVTGKKVTYAGISGLLVFLIANFLMLAVENGEASVVIPIANMSFVVALIISVTLNMERLTMRKGVAVIIAISSIMLLSRA